MVSILSRGGLSSFHGTEVRPLGQQRITVDGPDLVAVTTRHGIPLA